MKMRIQTETSRDDYDEPVYDERPRRAYPLERQRAAALPTLRGGRPAPGTTAPRYYKELTYKEVETNATDVNLGSVVNFVHNVVSMIVGLIAGGFVLFMLGDAASFGLKAIMSVGALFCGFMMIKSLREKGGDDGSRN